MKLVFLVQFVSSKLSTKQNCKIDLTPPAFPEHSKKRSPGQPETRTLN